MTHYLSLNGTPRSPNPTVIMKAKKSNINDRLKETYLIFNELYILKIATKRNVDTIVVKSHRLLTSLRGNLKKKQAHNASKSRYANNTI